MNLSFSASSMTVKSSDSDDNKTSFALISELLTCWSEDVMPAFYRCSVSVNVSIIVSVTSFLLVKLLSFKMYLIAASFFQKIRSDLICRSHVWKFFFSFNLSMLLWTTIVFIILQLKNRDNACRSFHTSYAEIQSPIGQSNALMNEMFV